MPIASSTIRARGRLPPRMSGEASSRAYLDLPGAQRALVEAVRAAAGDRPLAVVLMNGRPLAMEWMHDRVPAILEAWYGGVEMGNAVADVLFGDVNPGGKLPVTFPRTVGQVPIYYNHRQTGRPAYALNDYTSKYEDAPWTPLYPFGHGLSYTWFRYGPLRLSALRIAPPDTLAVTVDVTNAGPRAGDEVSSLDREHVVVDGNGVVDHHEIGDDVAVGQADAVGDADVVSGVVTAPGAGGEGLAGVDLARPGPGLEQELARVLSLLLLRVAGLLAAVAEVEDARVL